MDVKDIQVVEGQDNVNYENEAIKYLKNMGMTLPAKYHTQFIELAKLYNLNPFKREIYAVGYGENFNIITGYEVYLKRAEMLGSLDGWKCETIGEGNNLKAKITIHRKDRKYPFEHEVKFTEFAQKTKDGKLNAIWTKMPDFMIKKVCIAQGFRMCFPLEFGGMPYTSDEIGQDQNNAPEINSGKCIYSDDQITELLTQVETLTEEHKDVIRKQWKKVPYELLSQKIHELKLLENGEN